jgi:hypothetical protein
MLKQAVSSRKQKLGGISVECSGRRGHVAKFSGKHTNDKRGHGTKYATPIRNVLQERSNRVAKGIL